MLAWTKSSQTFQAPSDRNTDDASPPSSHPLSWRYASRGSGRIHCRPSMYIAEMGENGTRDGCMCVCVPGGTEGREGWVGACVCAKYAYERVPTCQHISGAVGDTVAGSNVRRSLFLCSFSTPLYPRPPALAQCFGMTLLTFLLMRCLTPRQGLVAACKASMQGNPPAWKTCKDGEATACY